MGRCCCCCRERSRLRRAVQMRIMGNRHPIRMNWRQTGTTGPIWPGKQTRWSMLFMNPKPAPIQTATENRERLSHADYLPHMSDKSHLCKHRPTQVNYPSGGGIPIRNQGRCGERRPNGLITENTRLKPNALLRLPNKAEINLRRRATKVCVTETPTFVEAPLPRGLFVYREPFSSQLSKTGICS